MSTRRDEGRITAGATALLLALLVGAAGTLVSLAARPKPEPCPAGRYLVDGAPLLSGVATTPADGVTVAGGQVSLDGACAPVAGKVKTKRKGTSVKTTWPLCEGVEGKVRLKGKIEPSCQTLTGKVIAKKARVKTSFTAILSTCGDGVIDPPTGEECEADLDCTPPATCTDDCECLAESTTTTTPGGSTTTSATFSSTTTTASSTSSTIGGGSTTSTTLPTVPGPDPATTAPPLDPSTTTGFAAKTSFLFAGASPVQFNVAPGAIDPVRAAVVRGTVLDDDGGSLAAVLVRIAGHPEFGQTLSRSDGAFDMAVNGGGPLELVYEKSGFLSARRTVTVPWQDFATAPEVRLVPVDAQATAIDLAAATEITVARGSAQTDADGTRQATLLVEPGTAAEMVMPDGSTQALPSITVRATEFTVGDAGPERMPAVLPAQSGYTYAVEFSVDEAMAEGAAMVKFDRPIPTYVENFTGFPAGTPVPAGYFDRVQGKWIAAPNGIVIAIVGESGGRADVDVTGDGTADTGTALTDLGIDDAERETLAGLYDAGQSLWRVQVDHFTPWDYNWPMGPPDDAEDPADAGAGADSDDEPLDGACEASGSVIECENQVLGEEVLIAGTPYTLNYRSDRVPGRIDSLDVRLIGASVPASLTGIRVRATVAGQTIEQNFPAEANQSVVLTWDGTDAYGRTAQGGQPVTGSIDYLYPLVYRTPSEFGQAFARVGGAVITGNREESSLAASMPFSAVMREGITDARGLGLGGWTLDVHHFYDPVTQVLHLGSGQRRKAESVARVIDQFDLETPLDDSGARVDFGPDKSLYSVHVGGSGVADNVVRRRAPDGTQVIVAGGGNTNVFPFGEGGPAVGASLLFPNRLEIGPDGLLYIMDSGAVVLRVDADGVMRRVAGRERVSTPGSQCPRGAPASEGAVAVETDLCLSEFTVAPDGSLYLLENFFNGLLTRIVSRVGTDGLITRFAGTGVRCFSGTCGDGGPATAATFEGFGPGLLTVAPDGSVLLASSQRVRRVTPDGIIAHYAGSTSGGFSGDGGSADLAQFCGGVSSAEFGLDGSLYLLDVSNRRVRRIAPDGIISTVAGSGAACDSSGAPTQSGDRGPALQAVIGNMLDLAVAPDGEVFVYVNGVNPRFGLRRIGSPLPGFSAADILVASQDGRSLYVFDPNGKHLATADALTGSVRREFGYDADGRLVTVTERTGGTDNVTAIERSAAGQPTGIVGPFGKRTTLATDANGFLSSITNAAGETTGLTSTASGLLTAFTAPGNRTTTFSYDAAGRLLRHEDAADGSQDLARTGTPDAFTVTRTTVLGRSSGHQVETLPNRVRNRTITAPDGTEATVTENLDAATRESTAPSGTVTTMVAGGDPRFGVEAPVTTSVSLRLPSGLVATSANARTASVADPFDPLSLVELTESSTVDGRTATTSYTAATRTFLTTSPLGRTRTLTLDVLGRPETLQAAGGVATAATYDARGRLASLTTGSDPAARTFTFTYDAQGLPATVTDAVSRTTTMERDAVGRLTRKVLPDGDAIALGFDGAGDFVSLTPPGRPAHTFTYDARGALVSSTPPAVPGTGPTTYAYDDDGAITTVARPGETVEFTYDAAGRVSALDLDVQGGSHDTYTVAYDGTTGQVTQLAGPAGGTIAYTYDGMLLTGVSWTGPVTGSLEVEHDTRLAVTTETVNGTSAVSFTHDDDGHLVAAGDLAITRDATTGLPASTTLGVVSDTWVHDGFGELVDYEATANGTPIYAETFEYDGLGRVSRRVETIGGSTDTLDYAYDLKGQLVEVHRDGALVESYTYDPNGNRVAATIGGGSITATYDDQDRLLTHGTSSFTHTPSGRLATRTTPGGTTTYTYDAAGNLLAVDLPGGTDVAYALDPAFRRGARDVGGVAAERFLWSGSRPIAELDAAGAIVSRFVYAGGPTPAYLVRGGVAHRLVTDQVGSVRLVVDAVTGALAQRLDYDSFGRVTADTNPGFQPFGFAGGLYDPATGLVRFDARDYDAATGRWTAKDPIGFASRDTNLYRYVGNDPVNRIDPSGLTVDEIAAAILAGIGDVALAPLTLQHQLNELGAVIAEAITGTPVVVPPDPNPTARLMEDMNALADSYFGWNDPMVDTSSTAFGVTRTCTGIAVTAVAGAAGAAAGAARESVKGGIRPAMQAASKNAKNVARTADPDYRPLVDALNKQAERLAAEEAASKASALARAKEAIGRWLQNLGFSGGRDHFSRGFSPGGQRR